MVNTPLETATARSTDPEASSVGKQCLLGRYRSHAQDGFGWHACIPGDPVRYPSISDVLVGHRGAANLSSAPRTRLLTHTALTA